MNQGRSVTLRTAEARTPTAGLVHVPPASMTEPPHPELVASLSREPALAVDADGAITWADERTRRLLGRPPRLRAVAAPGPEDEVDRDGGRGGANAASS